MDTTTILMVGLAFVIGGVVGRSVGLRSRAASASTVDAVHVDHADAPQETATLALFDVDNLTSVNESNDFDTGDRLLNAVAEVLDRGLSQGAALERLDRGRFLISWPGEDIEQTAKLAEALRKLACGAQVQGTDGPVARTLTAGVVAMKPEENRTRAILRADVALAGAKEAGGDRTRTVHAHPAPSLIPSTEVIKEAIATRALEYHVQPILRLSDRQPVGVENLLRWNRPDGSVAGPGRFLDTLNRLPEAGAALLPHLATKAATPFVTGPDPIYATFNITGAVLDGKGSAACRWLNHIVDTLPHEHLVLELVETAIIMAPERAQDLMGRLRQKGLRIALDDFGTGLSNLERLCRYQFDILKVDRAFCAGLGTTGREEAVLGAMVSLANGMNVDLIAEGIESEEEALALLDIGVKYGQGYHLGRPASASDWAARMHRTA